MSNQGPGRGTPGGGSVGRCLSESSCHVSIIEALRADRRIAPDIDLTEHAFECIIYAHVP